MISVEHIQEVESHICVGKNESVVNKTVQCLVILKAGISVTVPKGIVHVEG